MGEVPSIEDPTLVTALVEVKEVFLCLLELALFNKAAVGFLVMVAEAEGVVCGCKQVDKLAILTAFLAEFAMLVLICFW